jgi:peptidoglycan/LPS O-acetylase OafA/YrhL
MFFSLSGFLVAGSLERTNSLFKFLGLRVFRIMPALSVEVLVSALILGPVFTSLNFADYFGDPLFHHYFLNVVGHIQYLLPGVFEKNPLPLVNGQLWTVPYELVCYVLLAFLAVLGIYRNGRWLLAFIVAFYLFQIGNTIFRPNFSYRGAGGVTTVMMFSAGLLLYRYRERIVWSGWLALLCAVVSLASILIPNGIRFAALPAAYFTIYLGLLNPPRERISLSGDYSYGLYLYGFPIQQAVVAALPNLREWYWNILISLPLATAIAVLSWWIVERPILRSRQVLDRLDDWLKIRLRRRPIEEPS